MYDDQYDKFVEAVADAVAVLVPADVRVRTEHGRVVLDWADHRDSVDVSTNIADNLDGDLPLMLAAQIVVANTLSTIQDIIVRWRRMPWPTDASAALALPNVEAQGDTLCLWFGEARPKDDSVIGLIQNVPELLRTEPPQSTPDRKN